MYVKNFEKFRLIATKTKKMSEDGLSYLCPLNLESLVSLSFYHDFRVNITKLFDGNSKDLKPQSRNK